MITAEQLAEAVIQEARTRPSILGSQLGFFIKKAFPEVRLREDFGGLRNFVERHCAGQVCFIGKHGLDDVYQASSTTAAKSLAAPSAKTVAPLEQPTFWSIFTNARGTWSLWVNRASGQLACSNEIPGAADEWFEIARMTSEEHRQIAAAFLETVEPPDRERLAPILEQPDYWMKWSSEIRTLQGGRYQKAWVDFRREHIHKLFHTRIEAAGLPDEPRKRAFEELEKSRRVLRSTAASPAVGRSQTTAQWPPTVSPIHEIAERAISQMSEDELRRVWLPLGAVTDAIRGRRS